MKNNLLLTLIAIRGKAMVRNFGKSLHGKKKSKVIPVVFALLMLYLVAVFEFMFVMLWDSLAVFCTVGLTWLYFGLCGFFATAMTVIFNMFATQNQLYNASDNELLLSMPIPPGAILMSRMAVLLASSLGTTILVMAPSVGVYLYRIGGLTAAQVAGILLSVLSVTLTAQALACVFGYILHLILRRVKNKAVGSMLFMILFLVVYYSAYSQVGKVITYLAANGAEVAAFMKAWAAPFYALGLACTGKLLSGLLLILGALLLFGVVYWVLSVTFIGSVQGKSTSGGEKKSSTKALRFKCRTPVDAVCYKEFRRLFTSPIYLTNTGLGCFLLLAAAVVAPFFGSTILSYLAPIPGITRHLPLLVAALIATVNGLACFTAPSVSLEGKSLWVMRSLPISGRDVLLGKLKLHLLLTGSSSVLAGLSLSVTLHCNPIEVILITLLSAEIAAVMGMLGLIYNLLLPNFKWLNEATPCKQGMPVLFIMFSGMGTAILGGLAWYLTESLLTPALFLAILCLLCFLACLLLYRSIAGWGGRRFESFE